MKVFFEKNLLQIETTPKKRIIDIKSEYGATKEIFSFNKYYFFYISYLKK